MNIPVRGEKIQTVFKQEEASQTWQCRPLLRMQIVWASVEEMFMLDTRIDMSET